MQVSNNCPIYSTSFRSSKTDNVEKSTVNLDMPNDTVELSTKQENSKTKEEKQEIC